MPNLLGKWICLGLLVFASGQAGEQAPAFVLSSVDGRTINLADSRGKLVFLSFISPTCYPCRQEIPFLNKLNRDNPDYISFFAVMQGPNKLEQAVALKSDMNVQIPLLYDPSGDVSNRYSVAALPRGFLISEKGQILKVYPGFLEQALDSDINQEIKRLYELKRNCLLFIKPFLESTESARQEQLGSAYKTSLEQALSQNGYALAPSEAIARFVLTGSVAKLKSITGLSLSLEDELYGKAVLDENFSLNGSDLSAPLSKIQEKLSASCFKAPAPVKK